ncbi:COG4315 family predicted lipoprotein [Burkholderia sp. PU8-34]
MKRMLLVAALTAGASLPAAAEPPQVSGGKLVDEDHMTLYMFDHDALGKSMCDSACTANWPPAVADAYDKASGAWSIVKRDDGKTQWAYKGHPLYRWKMDHKAGDAGGDGIGGMWHVARP